ncbi:MAG: cupin domain-containing protein [Thermoplasmata archaeon]|nr:MAG: cupin domain-containing protein [Thermoplasmata archaeon]
MEFVNVTDIKNFKKSKIIKSVPILTDQLMASTLCIDSNLEMPVHIQKNKDVIFYIFSGQGKITIDNKTSDIEEGMIVLVPRNKFYSFSTNNDQLIILSFRNTTN